MKLIFGFLFCYLMPAALYAQEQGRIIHYTIKQGLSVGVVHSIIQDERGLMWFGTDDGLNRFDGSEFKVFRHNPGQRESLWGNYVHSLFKDRNGTLWVSSRSGLSEYVEKKENFIRYKVTPSGNQTDVNDVSHISQAGGNALWVTLNGYGIAHFDTQNKKFRYYPSARLKGVDGNIILNTFEDSHGLLWLGTLDTGIKVFLRDSRQNLNPAAPDIKNVPSVRINQVFEDKSQNIWIASNQGLILYQRAQNSFHRLSMPEPYLNNICLSIQQDDAGNLLIGIQDRGVYRIAASQLHSNIAPGQYQFERLRDADGKLVTQRSPNALFEDKDRNIWIGTHGDGIYMLGSQPLRFRKFQQINPTPQGESQVRFYGMCYDTDGMLWLGTDGDGIYKTNSSGITIKHYLPGKKSGSITDGAIISAFRDSKNNLWFGSYSQGLFKYNRKTDSFEQFAHQPGNAGSLPKNDVRVIFEDSRGNLWIGTNGGGLSLMDRQTGTFRTFSRSNSALNSNDVRCITEDQNGDLWIGTYGGAINRMDTKTGNFSAYFVSPGENGFVSNRVILSVYLDDKQRLWVGTAGDGLMVYDTRSRTIQKFSETTGLANDVINAIVGDTTDIAWISTNKGLSRVNLSTGTVANFPAISGLQMGQFNPGSGFFQRKGGYMVFGGTEGWNLFYPRSITASQFQPQIIISGVRLFGRAHLNDVPISSQQDQFITAIENKDEVVLQPDHSVFAIQYSALNYDFPEATRYAYMLEGYESNWNYVGNEHSATYRYLPPGNYTFIVKAANQDGIWSHRTSSLKLKILPPWYQTIWAYLVYTLCAGAVIYLYQTYRRRQRRLKYEIQIAQFETQKEKELNEKKISFFTNISHEFRTPLTLIINPVRELIRRSTNGQINDDLQTIYRNARRLLSMIDQLLLFRQADRTENELKPAWFDLWILLEECYLYFIQQATTNEIHYELAPHPETPLLFYGDKQKLEIAIFNVISNALKFTPVKGSVQIRVEENDHEVSISVSDSGFGLPTEAADSIFEVFKQFPGTPASKSGFGIGLYLTKTFIGQHDGSVSFRPNPTGGTIFEIRLPRKEHPKTETGLETVPHEPGIVDELFAPELLATSTENTRDITKELENTQKTLIAIDDDREMLAYLEQLLSKDYNFLKTTDGSHGLEMIRQIGPDLVISDVMMEGIDGFELCMLIKSDPLISHIPVVLLTAGTSNDKRLKGVEVGADEYISKPFDRDIFLARIASLIKTRTDLQKYFYNEITLQNHDFKIPAEYRDFLKDCIQVVEKHLDDPQFNTKTLAAEIGMSHSTLYNKIKSVSGQSINSFIRFVRLRRAAQMLITSNTTVSEAAFQVGINDIKYFRESFQKLFGMKPSEYIKKYRHPFHERTHFSRDVFPKK